MRKNTLVSAMATLVVTIGASAGSAQAASPPTFAFEGGPVMSGYRTVEVVWSHSASTQESADVEGLGGFLNDIAAANGSTQNVFSVLPQYSTSGLPKGEGRITAYRSSYEGSFQIAPATGVTVTEAQIQTALKEEIAAGNLPAPVADTTGAPETIYVLVMPPNMAACIEGNCSGPTESGSEFCSTHGSGTYNSTPFTFNIILDLSGDLAGGCGTSVEKLKNETSNLTHQIAETVTDPLVAEGQIGWYGLEGEIADYCDEQNSSEATNTINGHTWTVQKIWSLADDACVASTSIFTPPSTSFTATPSGNSASFAASGESTNHLAHVPAGIASYSWDFGDGQSGEGATPTHAYTAGGTFTVTLTATDSLGFTAHASHQVTVSAPPPNTGGSSGSGVNTGLTGNTGPAGIVSTGTPSSTPTAKASISPAGGASTTTTGSSVVISSGETATCPPQGGACVVTVLAEVEAAHTAAVSAKKHKPKSHKVVVGSANTTVAAGATAKLTFKLNAAGKALLQAHHSLLVRLVVTIHHGDEAAVVSTHTIAISAPKKHGHK